MPEPGICVGLGDNALLAILHKAHYEAYAEEHELPYGERTVNGEPGICVGLGDGTQQEQAQHRANIENYAKMWNPDLYHEDVDDCC